MDPQLGGNILDDSRECAESSVTTRWSRVMVFGFVDTSDDDMNTEFATSTVFQAI